MARTHSESRPWKAASAWLALLGPLFFLVYGFTNWFTAQREGVPSFYFGWEEAIPFVPQLMLPYMSIDLFFAASLFLFRDRRELNNHAWRIIAAILISAAGFLLFPLQFAFERPAVEGFNGYLLNILTSFDKPFNQAPSLHISLLMILWAAYTKHISGMLRPLLHLWFILIALSVVLVYQHHMIDVISGFAVGIICLYLFPVGTQDNPQLASSDDPRSRVIAWRYGLAAALCLFAAITLQGLAWLLLWPALALLVVASGYLRLDSTIFQKHAGRHSFAARWLLAPYLAGAWLAYRFFSRGYPAAVAITDEIFIGRLPRTAELESSEWHSVIDLTAEFSAPTPTPAQRYYNMPLLDLLVPETETLRQAARLIEEARREGPVLVHCALGASRSVAAVIAWLVQYGHASDITEAESLIASRWRTVLTPAHRSELAKSVA